MLRHPSDTLETKQIGGSHKRPPFYAILDVGPRRGPTPQKLQRVVMYLWRCAKAAKPAPKGPKPRRWPPTKWAHWPQAICEVCEVCEVNFAGFAGAEGGFQRKRQPPLTTPLALCGGQHAAKPNQRS